MDLSLFTAYLAGILSTLTPCVYPLIPITLSIIRADINSGRVSALINSALYSLGIFISYTCLGLIAVYSAGFFGEIWASRWVRYLFGLFMLVLALYSAEIFKFRSSGWLSKIINKVSLSSSYGAISTGLISGILAAPCTGPLLAAILAFAAGSADKTRGIFLLVFYSFGFCTPFLFLSFFPRLINIMPKSGYWLHAVKFIIAVCLLSIAFDYLDINNFIPVILTAFIDSKILLAVNLALFLLSINIFLKLHRKNQQKLNLIALCISAYLLFLVQLELRNKYQDFNFAAAKSYNLENPDSRPKILFFTADWCAKCPQIKHYLTTDSGVIAELTNFQLIEVDLTQISESEKKLQSKYEIKGLPSLVFTCSDLQEMNTPKLQDVTSSTELLHKLKLAGQIAKSCQP